MSETDSFIQEVSEEVRRDRLFRLMKKYGWIAVTLIVLLVGGAAFNEWQKAKQRATAQAYGDQILSALQNDDPALRSAALAEIQGEGEMGAVLALLTSSEELAGEDREKAVETLEGVAADQNLPTTYRHLAELKLVLVRGDEMSPADRMARLEPLTAAGAPYRLVAEEQMAIAEVAAGDTDKAIQRLQDILADGEVTAGLRRRVSQLIVALGGQLAPA